MSGTVSLDKAYLSAAIRFETSFYDQLPGLSNEGEKNFDLGVSTSFSCSSSPEEVINKVLIAMTYFFEFA
jgi:hypothetical protein